MKKWRKTRRTLLLVLAAVFVLNGIICEAGQASGTEFSEDIKELSGENEPEDRAEEESEPGDETEDENSAEDETEDSAEDGNEGDVPAGKADGKASVTMAGWTYSPDNSGAQAPVPVSETNGTENVTYLYKESKASDDAYSPEIPGQAGTYTVKAVFAETETYKEVTATADFTIARAMPEITFEKVEDELEETGFFSIRVVASGEAPLTIWTNNEDVAVVDEEKRIVRFIGSGEVRITAGMEASDNYQSSTVIIAMVIVKEKKLSAIVLEKEAYYVTYGADDFNINVIYKLGKADIIWKSDNEKVAEVDQQGRVSIKGAGKAVLTASMEEDDDYIAASSSVTINVAESGIPPSRPPDGEKETEVSPETERLSEIPRPGGWKDPDRKRIPDGSADTVNAASAGTKRWITQILKRVTIVILPLGVYVCLWMPF